MVSIIGNAIMASRIYSVFGYLDPEGRLHPLLYIMSPVQNYVHIRVLCGTTFPCVPRRAPDMRGCGNVGSAFLGKLWASVWWLISHIRGNQVHISTNGLLHWNLQEPEHLPWILYAYTIPAIESKL